MTWEEVIARSDIIGRDLETHQGDREVYRGPIKSIEIKDEGGGPYVHFHRFWTAKLDGDTGTWKKWSETECMTMTSRKPNEKSDGSIWFDMTIPGFGIIHPKGEGELDPAEVEGLEL